MNAQENWKRLYSFFADNPLDVMGVNCRNKMHSIRREAALERRIASLERENARLHEGVEAWAMFDDEQVSKCFKKYRALNKRFEKLYHVAHSAVAHVGAANCPEHEEQAHDWIDAV